MIAPQDHLPSSPTLITASLPLLSICLALHTSRRGCSCLSVWTDDRLPESPSIWPTLLHASLPLLSICLAVRMSKRGCACLSVCPDDRLPRSPCIWLTLLRASLLLLSICLTDYTMGGSENSPDKSKGVRLCRWYCLGNVAHRGNLLNLPT